MTAAGKMTHICLCYLNIGSLQQCKMTFASDKTVLIKEHTHKTNYWKPATMFKDSEYECDYTCCQAWSPFHSSNILIKNCLVQIGTKLNASVHTATDVHNRLKHLLGSVQRAVEKF